MSWEIEHIGDCTLYRGDCREILPTLGKVDAVVTDPPYGVAYTRHVTNSGAPGWKHRWDFHPIVGDSEVTYDWVPMVACPAVYLMTRWDVAHLWRQVFVDDQWKHKATVVWDHIGHGIGDLAAYVTTHDFILIFTRQRLRLKSPQQDMLRIRRIDHGASGRDSHNRLLHPTQKPVPVFAALIRPTYFATVLDPFMGSGTTGVACVQLGRSFLGIEVERQYFDLSCRRIEEAYRQLTLWDQAVMPLAQQEVFL